MLNTIISSAIFGMRKSDSIIFRLWSLVEILERLVRGPIIEFSSFLVEGLNTKNSS